MTDNSFELLVSITTDREKLIRAMFDYLEERHNSSENHSPALARALTTLSKSLWPK